jgi:hypothetical protein
MQVSRDMRPWSRIWSSESAEAGCDEVGMKRGSEVGHGRQGKVIESD